MFKNPFKKKKLSDETRLTIAEANINNLQARMKDLELKVHKEDRGKP